MLYKCKNEHDLIFQYNLFLNVMKIMIADGTRMCVILARVLMHVELLNVGLMQDVKLGSTHINAFALTVILETPQLNVIHVGLKYLVILFIIRICCITSTYIFKFVLNA